VRYNQCEGRTCFLLESIDIQGSMHSNAQGKSSSKLISLILDFVFMAIRRKLFFLAFWRKTGRNFSKTSCLQPGNGPLLCHGGSFEGSRPYIVELEYVQRDKPRTQRSHRHEKKI